MYPEGPITDLQHPDEEMKTLQKAVSLLLETTVMALPTDDWDITTISVVHDGTATYATMSHKSDPSLEIGIRLWDPGVVHEEEG